MLELKNISKKFKDRQILSDFNLTVEENKILAKKSFRFCIPRFSAFPSSHCPRKSSFISNQNYEYGKK